MPEIVVFLAEGRSPEVKAQLMKDISEAVSRRTGVSEDNVTVSIVETPLENKMKGGVTFSQMRRS